MSGAVEQPKLNRTAAEQAVQIKAMIAALVVMRCTSVTPAVPDILNSVK